MEQDGGCRTAEIAGDRIDRLAILLQRLGMIMLLMAAAAAGAPPAPADKTLGQAFQSPVAKACKAEHPGDVLVCGRAGQPYRIDPAVLEANREANANPPRPPVTVDSADPSNSCVGGQGCTGGVIPLVGMAVVAAKAVALAADGDDWRDAIRTQPEEYRLYQQAQARQASERKVRIGIVAAAGK